MTVSAEEIRVGRVRVGVVLRKKRGAAAGSVGQEREETGNLQGANDLVAGGDGLGGDHGEMGLGVEEASLRDDDCRSTVRQSASVFACSVDSEGRRRLTFSSPHRALSMSAIGTMPTLSTSSPPSPSSSSSSSSSLSSSSTHRDQPGEDESDGQQDIHSGRIVLKM